jgi:hypothetical protein
VASIRARLGCGVARAAASDGRPALTAGHAAALRRLAARWTLRAPEVRIEPQIAT